MQVKEKPIFGVVEGRTVSTEELAGFVTTMSQQVIPEAVNMLEKRRLLAVQKREEQLKC